jgi:ribosome recycling factor
MTVADTKKSAEQKMQKSIEAFKADLAKVRTGRAHTGLLDHVQVDYYGSMVPISQVASQPCRRPHDLRAALGKEDGPGCGKGDPRRRSGPEPGHDGRRDPRADAPLTEERRKELTKVVKGEAEGAKVAVRNLRRDANEQFKKLVKDKAISEDDERRGQDEVQKLTDKFVAEIDKLVAEKEKEIMTV